VPGGADQRAARSAGLAGGLADGDDAPTGDPMEVALLRAGSHAGMRRDDLLEDYPEGREESFSSETKMMATFHRQGDGYLVAVKGAPEQVIAAAASEVKGQEAEPMDDAARKGWLRRNEELAEDGLRVIAVARKTAQSEDAAPYEELELLGLVGLYDPPREDVAETIAACHAAGVRVVMATGDQVATARNIGRELGILKRDDAEVLDGQALDDADDATIEKVDAFARVDPGHKMQLIAAFQNAGDIVAMIGDGVNDAPALKKASIGVAMGKRGTEVAREAADIVLRDDRLATIVMAIRQGRTIFLNIRKFVIFLLSGNLGQILAVSGAVLLGAPLPLLPLQILFLNMVLDVFPALALGMGDDAPTVMDKPPRDPAEPILGRDQWWAISGFAALIGGSVLAVFGLARTVFGMSTPQAVTVAFLCYATARLWHVFNMRSVDSGLLRNNIVRNPFVWGAIAVSGGLLALAIFFPPLASLLALERPATSQAWILAVAGGLAPLVTGQIAIAVLARRHHD
jgi:Ca2+-transporting ATPase